MAAFEMIPCTSFGRFEGDLGECLLHLSVPSRHNRVRFHCSEFVLGLRVKFTFALISDALCILPLPGAIGSAVVHDSGFVELHLAFGMQVSQEQEGRALCGIILPQRVAPPKGQHLSLQLLCTVQLCSPTGTSETERIAQFRMLVTSNWAQVVQVHGSALFTSNIKDDPDSLPLEEVFRLMRQRWASMFGHLKAKDQRIEAARAKLPSRRDDVKLVAPKEYPELHNHHMEDLLRLATGQSDRKELSQQKISRSEFCRAPDSPHKNEGSLWSIFEMLIELIGRFPFVRRLFAAGQLYIIAPEDLLEFHSSDVSVPQILHLFRLARSLSSPGLVLEMFVVKDGAVKKESPSPYVTVEQISAEGGRVYNAFSNLVSVHHEKLTALDPTRRLCPDLAEAPKTEKGVRRIRNKRVGDCDSVNSLLSQSDLLDHEWWSGQSKLE